MALPSLGNGTEQLSMPYTGQKSTTDAHLWLAGTRNVAFGLENSSALEITDNIPVLQLSDKLVVFLKSSARISP